MPSLLPFRVKYLCSPVTHLLSQLWPPLPHLNCSQLVTHNFCVTKVSGHFLVLLLFGLSLTFGPVDLTLLLEFSAPVSLAICLLGLPSTLGPGSSFFSRLLHLCPWLKCWFSSRFCPRIPSVLTHSHPCADSFHICYLSP